MCKFCVVIACLACVNHGVCLRIVATKRSKADRIGAFTTFLLGFSPSAALNPSGATVFRANAKQEVAPLHRQQPFCIGVAGATASGKSSVVEEIVRQLNHDHVVSVTQDCFYRNLSPKECEQANRQEYNFDHPHAFDFEHQRRVLSELRSGPACVPIPTYDFVTHSRRGTEHDRIICDPEIVIFEGILGLYDEEMRSQYDLKIYVDVDADVRLARRIRRDMESRGRDLSGILKQYERFVKPATEQFVLPTKKYADIVVPRGVENTVAIDIIARHINDVLTERELQAEAESGLWQVPLLDEE